MSEVKIEVVKACDIHVEKLVKLVRSRTMLYDYNLKGYRNKELTNKLWNEVASQLRAPVTVCKSKWYSLRGDYSKHLRRAKRSTPGYPHGKDRGWHLAGLLSFLRNFMGHPKKRINLHDDEDSSLGDDYGMHSDDTPEVVLSENAEIQEALDLDDIENNCSRNLTAALDSPVPKHDNKIMEISQQNNRSEMAVQPMTDFPFLESLPSSCQLNNRSEMVVQPVTGVPVTSCQLNNLLKMTVQSVTDFPETCQTNNRSEMLVQQQRVANFPKINYQPIRPEMAVQRVTDFPKISCQKNTQLEMAVQTPTDFPKTNCPPKLDDGAYLHFFKSLLPDIGKLDERRQRKFKEDVLRTLNQYLDEQEDARDHYQIVSYSSITPSHSTSYSSLSPHSPTVSLDIKIESE